MKFLFFGHSPFLAQLMHFKGNMLTQGALKNVKEKQTIKENSKLVNNKPPKKIAMT